MGRYLHDARHHAEKIEHYYKYAGERGYRQAVGHWNDLADLIRRARNSKNDKSDAPSIQEISESVKNMMDEMKEREAKPEST
jgi:hypothetical protein